MDLREYLRVLRRRWRLVVLTVLASMAAAAGWTATQAPVYTATTQLFVAAQQQGDAGIGGAYTGGLFVQTRVKSYAAIIGTPRIAQLVVDELGLGRPATQVAKQVTASAPLDTVLIRVSVRDTSPVRAQRIADSLGRQFAAYVDELERPAGGGPAPVKLTVVQPPQLPALPTSPRPKLNLLLGLILGTVVGAAAAVLRETLDTRIKAPVEAEQLADGPMLGAITFDADTAKTPLIVHTAPQSPRAEAFRQLRTNLQFIDVEHPLRSVAISSSLAGEGKSTTAANLAISLAQAGVQVILVEGDLRRPKVATYMGIEGAVGLTSVLLGRVALEDALQEWGGLTLRVLPSGPLPPNPSELLGSAGMQSLLREMESQADVILIDAPPLLPVTDAAVLGAMTSGVVLVVRSHYTRREQLKRAADIVAAVGATTLGVVLNMVPTRGPDSYAYGYGYGYGYGYYGASRREVGKLTADEAARGVFRSRAPGGRGPRGNLALADDAFAGAPTTDAHVAPPSDMRHGKAGQPSAVADDEAAGHLRDGSTGPYTRSTDVERPVHPQEP